MNGHSDIGQDGRRQNGSHDSQINNKKGSGGKTALLVCLIITALAVAAMGLFVPSDGAKNPIEAFMLFARNGFKHGSDIPGGGTDGSGSASDPATEPGSGSVTGTVTADEPSGTVPPAPTDTGVTDSPTTAAPEEPINPTEYYKNTLFIGDSRTAGLYIYGRIEGASYFARTSMNVGNCFNSSKSETGTGSLSLEAYLKKNRFGKIYVLLGINEIGYSYDWIVTRYEKLISRLQELQPGAVIVIQSNMHVTKAKSDSSPKTFNNTRINELNRRLSGLADGKKVFYLSFESIFDGADGNMNPDYSGDGVHLKAKSYKIWRDYLLSEGMLRLPENTDITVITNPGYSGGGDRTDGTTDRVTEPPVTEPPTTEPPTTEPPTTEPPTTEPPTTEPPTTEPPTTEPPTTEPPETEPPITEPDDGSYFSDALFIGDSRTVGLYLYGRLRDDGATFFAKNGATVYTFLNGYETAKPDSRMGDRTLSEVLAGRKFGKIYILFGINELGGSAPSAVRGGFERFVSLLKAAQPNAKIIIQSNMHVTKAYEEKYPVRGKDRVNELNSLLAGLANGKDVFYLGFETLFDDEEGYLREDYARDGLHMLAGEPYNVWRGYITEFGML
jgi:lysophospholipase L1-like esterase